jgi:hypothetical protein
VDPWIIMVAVWLPVAGILLALCLYDMTEAEGAPTSASFFGGRQPNDANTTGNDEIYPNSNSE